MSVHHHDIHFSHLHEFFMAYCAAYIPAEAKSRLTLTSIFPPMIFIKFCTRVIVHIHMTIMATPARFSVASLAASIQQQYQVLPSSTPRAHYSQYG